uniref:transcription factor IIIB 70 kDa subunit-like n=1 Tax=Fragaria vesca subsp. vesca TaxID=101020 RepID=UPI0005C94E48|nr:PREDICTED: transcription factor IIIB 70 kDa subunit-like [Fragaria vesca subsp. vesca]
MEIYDIELLLSCRTKRKPYLLIEFSNFLKIDVYTLGAVYMQLSKVLYLDEFPFASLPVDPSIFIAKFSESLPGGRNKGVTKTAVRIINSMKRNWMQEEKPSGLCGAALYISALSHGLKCSKSDFVRIAHVCDATLTKRLIEFVNTDSGSLTIEEFHLKESEMEELCEEPNTAVKIDSGDDILCVHKDSGIPFAHGLCKLCYDDLMKISGGLRGGSDPPSFQRAEIERRKKASAQENPSESDVDMLPCQSVDNNQQSNFGREVNSSRDGGNGMLHSMENVGAPTENEAVHAGNESCDESDNLSDIDDVEVDEYLLDEEGKHNKKIIWEALNREYIEEQAAKAAMGTECPESQAAAAQKRKERQLARAAEGRNATPAQTAAEAAYRTLSKKVMIINNSHDIDKDRYISSPSWETAGVSKKKRIDSQSDNDEEMPFMENQEFENNDDFGPDTEYEDYNNGFDFDNVHEGYDNCEFTGHIKNFVVESL